MSAITNFIEVLHQNGFTDDNEEHYIVVDELPTHFVFMTNSNAINDDDYIVSTFGKQTGDFRWQPIYSGTSKADAYMAFAQAVRSGLDMWYTDGDLVYRINDDCVNRDEIKVSMCDSTRKSTECYRLAKTIADFLNSQNK